MLRTNTGESGRAVRGEDERVATRGSTVARDGLGMAASAVAVAM